MRAAALLLIAGLVLPAPEYSAIYSQGVPFATFLEQADSSADEWRAMFEKATVDADAVARAKALKQPVRILVVAEYTCKDSMNTVPYLARLVEASPDTLSLRVVRKAVGLPVMEAHKTPDGRAATPTIVALDAEGGVKGVFIERPAALVAFAKDHSERSDRLQWYAEDKGHHAISDLLDLFEK